MQSCLVYSDLFLQLLTEQADMFTQIFSRSSLQRELMELKTNIIVDYVNYSKRHSEGFECEYYSWLSTILCNKLSFSKTLLELETDLVINKKT